MRKGFQTTLLGVSLLAGCAASARSNTDVVFADFRLQVPGGQSAVAVQDDELFLALRYGPEAGKDYLIFTNRPTVPTHGCPPEEFFSRAMEGRETTGGDECDTALVDDFRSAFVDPADSGVWEGAGFKAYYLLQESKSMVYLVGSDGEYVKVDTDHLDAGELEALVDTASPL